MGWTSVSPIGTSSVKANRTTMAANTVYIENTMNVDHFWNIAAKEGLHKYARMPKSETTGTPSDPVLGATADLVYYAKQKTLAEATAGQDVQGFLKNSSAVMQILGIRACGVINIAGGGSTTVYSHNCTIARTGAGRFTATFTAGLPTANYLFLGGGIAQSANTDYIVTCEVESSLDVNTVKTTALVKFRTILNYGTTTVTRIVADPLQAYFVVFGG